MRRLLSCSACVFALIATGVAQGDLVDWTTASWTAGDTSNTVASTLGLNVGFNFTTGGGLAFAAQPTGSPGAGLQTPAVISNVSTFDDSLLWRFDNADVDSTEFINLNISFPVPVTNVSFSLGDIDTGSNNSPYQNWQDIVLVTGLNGSTEVPGSATSLGPNVGQDTDGNIYAPLGSDTISLYGQNGNVATTSANANATLSFAGPLTQINITYRPGFGADGLPGDFTGNQTSQFITLHDISLTAVPEPSSFLFLGLIATVSVGSQWKRIFRYLFGA